MHACVNAYVMCTQGKCSPCNCNVSNITIAIHFAIESASRKSLQEGFWNDEVHSEIIESEMKFRFCTDGNREACMIEIERLRRQSMYEHKCFEGCKQGNLYSGCCTYTRVLLKYSST